MAITNFTIGGGNGIATLNLNGGTITSANTVVVTPIGMPTSDGVISGTVINSATGTIAVAGNSGVTFYDDVTNIGTLNVATGSTAVFFGELASNGNIGGGDIQALGDLLPGASPGLMAFGGDLTMGPLTNPEIELGGTMPGTEFDTLDIGGDVLLAGLLDVALFGGFTLGVGDSFEFIGVDGTLNVALSRGWTRGRSSVTSVAPICSSPTPVEMAMMYRSSRLVCWATTTAMASSMPLTTPSGETGTAPTALSLATTYGSPNSATRRSSPAVRAKVVASPNRRPCS